MDEQRTDSRQFAAQRAAEYRQQARQMLMEAQAALLPSVREVRLEAARRWWVMSQRSQRIADASPA